MMPASLESLRLDWLRLSLIKGIGPQRFAILINAFQTPEAVLSASYSALSNVVGDACASAICEGADPKLIEKTLRWAEAAGHILLCSFEPGYPALLGDIACLPPVLYLVGNPELLSNMSLAMVGTRNPTPYGKKAAAQLSESLSSDGVTIVSGLAIGIDAAVHQAALNGTGSTIAVMATGADLIYPSVNRPLAEQIAEKGLLITEFPLGTAPKQGHFPQRNRIISGLSLGCLVVEAAISSGSLITAKFALEQNREVFSIPGSIYSIQSAGCNHLIKQGAKLVSKKDDIINELPALKQNKTLKAPAHEPRLDTQKPKGNHQPNKSKNSETASQSQLSQKEITDPLLIAMGDEPVDVDTLSMRLDWPVSKIQQRLLELELTEEVERLNTGRFIRRL